MTVWTRAQRTRLRVETAFFLTIQQVGRFCCTSRCVYIDLRVVLAMCPENPDHREGLMLTVAQRAAERAHAAVLRGIRAEEAAEEGSAAEESALLHAGMRTEEAGEEDSAAEDEALLQA